MVMRGHSLLRDRKFESQVPGILDGCIDNCAGDGQYFLENVASLQCNIIAKIKINFISFIEFVGCNGFSSSVSHNEAGFYF